MGIYLIPDSVTILYRACLGNIKGGHCLYHNWNLYDNCLSSMECRLNIIMTYDISQCKLQYTMYLSTVRSGSLAVNDRTMDVQVTLDRPSTP